MNYRVAAHTILISLLIFFIAVKVYYHFFPGPLSVNPSKIAIVKEGEGGQKFIDRNSIDGKEIIKNAYGPYTSFILQNSDLPLSTPSPVEFTLPHVRHNGNYYVLREHPALKYRLWQHRPPQVVLLGSSIFFTGFNREAFFSKHPSVRLLDFTTGNNTPFIANFMLQYADSLGLSFAPNTIFLYGMNRVEMLASYKGRDAHEHVKVILRGGELNQDKTTAEKISDFLDLTSLKYDVNQFLLDLYSRILRSENLYRKVVPDEYLQSAETLKNYTLKNAARMNDTTRSFDPLRVKEIQAIADLLRRHNSQLIILKLPLSSYGEYNVSSTNKTVDFNREANKLRAPNVRYIDVAAHSLSGIDDLDYLWPGKVFDPEHLNYHGAFKFTEYLMTHVIDSTLHKYHGN